LQPPSFLPRERFQELIDLLLAGGYTVLGPRIDQGAIIYDEIRHVDDLPRGMTDCQEAGRYRLTKRSDESYFGYVVGPHSWKKYLFPSVTRVASAVRTDRHWTMETTKEQPPKYAFLGARACELAAMDVQDRVFLGDSFVDPIYRDRREVVFVIAVNCTQAAPTCFCSSMNTGPRCTQGYDLGLTELTDGFVVETGTERGAGLARYLPTSPATADQLLRAEAARGDAERQITRRLDTQGIRDLLLGNLQHPHWDDVAQRCLSCANCTMVCPTCFCSTVSEVSDLTGDRVDRVRKWDSCFNVDFSYMNGGIVRDSIKDRYRQWLTHKLASWYDQFGSSGCVGCGRCITWCPVGIDLTEEVAALRRKVTLPLATAGGAG
jgi:ferredoxin